MISTFLLRSVSALCVMKFIAKIILKMKRIVPVTKIVAKESTLLRQILLRLNLKLFSKREKNENLFCMGKGELCQSI